MNLKMLTILALLASAAPCAAAPAAFAPAVAAADRPADARALDASRRPAEVLAFLGLEAGDQALDLMTGGGYYAELIGRAVGPSGTVTAWEPANFYDDKAKAGLAALSARVPNVRVLVSPADQLVLPPAAYDFVLMHLNYHDLYWESERFNFPRVEPDRVLATLFQAVRPGGIVGVIDHVGAPGGDTRTIADRLHRIDPAVVRADFERAGFVLDGSSDLLRSAADDRTKLVFDPAVRGRTDRIVYRFRKPG